MRRRESPDPLKPSHEPRWLVVRDPYGVIVESRARAPHTDLRAVPSGDRAQRIARGWAEEEIGPVSAYYFATLAGARHCVGIEAREAGLAAPQTEHG